MNQDMSPQVFDMLVALSHSPQHGYALMQRIETMHHGNYKPSPGVVYSNLQRMVDWGWVHEVPAPAAGGDVRRKHYKVSEQGLRAARAHLAKSQAMLANASKALGGVPTC